MRAVEAPCNTKQVVEVLVEVVAVLVVLHVLSDEDATTNHNQLNATDAHCNTIQNRLSGAASGAKQAKVTKRLQEQGSALDPS